jgi:hypothetical protein
LAVGVSARIENDYGFFFVHKELLIIEQLSAGG